MERKWWDHVAREVERLFTVHASALSYRVKRYSELAVFRFSPPLAPNILLVVFIGGDDYVNLHAEPTSGSRLCWDAYPGCADNVPPREVMVQILLHDLFLILTHKVRFREKRFLGLPLASYFEFYESGEWRPVPRFGWEAEGVDIFGTPAYKN